MTYCALFVLDREDFFEILPEFPNERDLVRTASITLAFRRAVLATACSRYSGALAKHKFSSLTHYLAENIANPAAHSEELHHHAPESTLLDGNQYRQDKIVHGLIQRSEARLDLHLKTMEEQLESQLKLSSQKTHDFVTTETVRICNPFKPANTRISLVMRSALLPCIAFRLCWHES